MNKDINKMIDVSENLGWSVQIDGNDYTFSQFSPAGQDFNIEVTAENLDEIINKIKERIDNFDCSYETYIWLDNTGHGQNGAPYDMKDLYDDMESCEKMMDELYEELCIIEVEDEEE